MSTNEPKKVSQKMDKSGSGDGNVSYIKMNQYMNSTWNNVHCRIIMFSVMLATIRIMVNSH